MRRVVCGKINANQIHKWSHRTRAENGPIISALQDWHLLQTPRHHGLHHSDPKNTYYCPITNFVNPLLERVNFWARVERVIERLTGVAHRHDTAVRSQGPGPAWLVEYRPKPAAPKVVAPRLAPIEPFPAKQTCARRCELCPARCTRSSATELVKAAA